MCFKLSSMTSMRLCFAFLDKQFGFNGGQFFFVVADKESAGQFIVLGLRQQVDGNPFVVRRFINDYNDFGWSGDRIDADISVDQFLAKATYWFPGPTILSTRGMVSVP